MGHENARLALTKRTLGWVNEKNETLPFPMIPSTKPIIAPVALESLSNPLEYDWVRGRYLVVQNNLGRKKKERRKAQYLYLC